MIETSLRKRPSLYKGEIGLFCASEMAEEDLRLIANGTDVLARITSPRNIQLLKYIWALASVVAESVDGVYDKDDGLELLCVKARHVVHQLDPVTGEYAIRRASLSRLSNEALRRLAERMKFCVETEIIPGMDEGALSKRLSEMVSP